MRNSHNTNSVQEHLAKTNYGGVNKSLLWAVIKHQRIYLNFTPKSYK
jgi:hypothetical protein